MTLKELHDRWSESPQRRLCALTRTATRLVVLNAHGNDDISGISVDDINAWLNGSSFTPADTVNALSAMRNMMAWAVQEGLWTGKTDKIMLQPQALGQPPCNTQEVSEPPVPESHKTRAGRRAPVDQKLIAPQKRSKPKDRTGDSRMKRAVRAVKAVGSRIKRTAAKALHQDLSRKGSAKWRGRTIGAELERKKVRPKREKKPKVPKVPGRRGRPPKPKEPKVPRIPEGQTAYTMMQQHLRSEAARRGYVKGDSRKADERLVIFVAPDTRRSFLHERSILRNGMQLRMLHNGAAATPLQTKRFSAVVVNLRLRAKKRGYILGDLRESSERMHVYYNIYTDRSVKTEQALESHGFKVMPEQTPDKQ